MASDGWPSLEEDPALAAADRALQEVDRALSHRLHDSSVFISSRVILSGRQLFWAAMSASVLCYVTFLVLNCWWGMTFGFFWVYISCLLAVLVAIGRWINAYRRRRSP